MARITADQLIQQLQTTVQQLAADQASIADLKIAAGALREMREGFKLLAPFRHVKKVSTFGSARVKEGDPVFRLAEEFARRIVEHGFMVITGAGGGIMEACQRGAGRERSFGVNIRFPHEQQATTIMSDDPKLMPFRYFFTRKRFWRDSRHRLAPHCWAAPVPHQSGVSGPLQHPVMGQSIPRRAGGELGALRRKLVGLAGDGDFRWLPRK